MSGEIMSDRQVRAAAVAAAATYCAPWGGDISVGTVLSIAEDFTAFIATGSALKEDR